MSDWNESRPTNVKRLTELLSGRVLDPVPVYIDRYSLPEDGRTLHSSTRYAQEIYPEISGDLLVIGSGRASSVNFIRENVKSVNRIVALDYVEEAGLGLLPDIEFVSENVLLNPLPGKFDYIFSSHTIEHFSREEILHNVLPKCLQAARKAVIFVVPYAENWMEEKSHRCLFYTDDEVAAQAKKTKLIFEGQELVLWFTGVGSV